MASIHHTSPRTVRSERGGSWDKARREIAAKDGGIKGHRAIGGDQVDLIIVEHGGQEGGGILINDIRPRLHGDEDRLGIEALKAAGIARGAPQHGKALRAGRRRGGVLPCDTERRRAGRHGAGGIGDAGVAIEGHGVAHGRGGGIQRTDSKIKTLIGGGHPRN